MRPVDPANDIQRAAGSSTKQNNQDLQFRNNTHDGNRPSGRKQQALVHQKFGMTPFDQQNTQNLQGNFAIIDQKIEERESLRHSTHRSQRSERVAAQQQHAVQHHNGFASGQNGNGAAANNGGANNVTATDHFDQTDYNVSEKSQGKRASGQQAADDTDEFVGYEQANIEATMQQTDAKSSSRMRMQGNYNQAGTIQTNQGGSSLSQQKQHIQHNVGRVQQIACGEGHILNLTRDGNVFSQGNGEYCNTGLGGSSNSSQLSLLRSLNDKRVVQIACGRSHSLVLTDKGYLYAWGRGFEG